MSLDKYFKYKTSTTKMEDPPSESTPKRLHSSGSEDSIEYKKSRQLSPDVSSISELGTLDESVMEDSASTTGTATPTLPGKPQRTPRKQSPANPQPAHDPNFDQMFNAMAALLADNKSPLYQSFASIVKTMIHEDLEEINKTTVELSSKVNKLDIEVISVQNDQVNTNTKLTDMEVRLSQLEDRVAKQESTIIEQTATIDANKLKISDLENKTTKLEHLSVAQGELNAKVNVLLQDVFNRVDELDQYGRRNMIRLSGIPESNTDSTDIVLDLARNLRVNLQRSDIDRCHRLGKLNSSGTYKTPRAIVVKFSNYAKRRELYDCRRDLKGSGIFMNDHLTPTRAKVMKKARDLKNKGAITNAWSTEGKLLCRDNNERIHVLTSRRDLEQFGSLDDTMSVTSAADDHQKID